MGVPCPFCKKMEKFRQIWPQQPLKHFTAAYRGSPPCTQSQHPINRETGYSNVLGTDTPRCSTAGERLSGALPLDSMRKVEVFHLSPLLIAGIATRNWCSVDHRPGKVWSVMAGMAAAPQGSTDSPLHHPL